jgi:hypothetical protein
MNKQLALIDIETVPARPSRRVSSRRDSAATHDNSPWWKLSEEEKIRGKAAIASIRALLNDSSDSDATYLAQAS